MRLDYRRKPEHLEEAHACIEGTCKLHIPSYYEEIELTTTSLCSLLDLYAPADVWDSGADLTGPFHFHVV